MLPTRISGENGEKFVPFSGNLLFLKSVLYEHNNYPIRIVLEADKKYYMIVVYETSNNLICIETSGETESIVKIPLTTLTNKKLNGFPYEVYVKESALR